MICIPKQSHATCSMFCKSSSLLFVNKYEIIVSENYHNCMHFLTTLTNDTLNLEPNSYMYRHNRVIIITTIIFTFCLKWQSFLSLHPSSLSECISPWKWGVLSPVCYYSQQEFSRALHTPALIGYSHHQDRVQAIQFAFKW